jgi:hypothetical protein
MNDIMNVALGMLLLPALTFVLIYPLALTRLPGVDSSYPKADVSKRIMAGAIDAMLFGCALYFWANAGSAWFVVAGAIYLAVRDALGGRSVGKFMIGLVVISLETGKPCSLAPPLRRNVVFLFPGVNLVAVVLECVTLVRDPFGYRLGDRWARTQVVEGLGAKEATMSVLRWIAPPARVGRAPARFAVLGEVVAR